MQALKSLFRILIAAFALSLCPVEISAGILEQLKNERSYSDERRAYYENWDPNSGLNLPTGSDPNNFFQSIDDLSIARNREVRRFLYTYLTRDRALVIRSLRRTAFYFELVNEIVQEGDLPPHLALLPLLESGFDPRAVSRSGAMGLWQFLPGTSAIFGLRIDQWTDERRHIEKSTAAAIRHLRNLYGVFGSWELALAAYNGGASTVKKAMIASNSRTFRELLDKGALRQETSEYVPRFAALTIIYNNQDDLGLAREIQHSAAPETVTFPVNGPVHIRRLCSLSRMSIEIFRRYNPEFKRHITPPYYKKYLVRVPVLAAQRLKRITSARYAAQWKGVRRYVIRHGDTISKISQRYRVSVARLIAVNRIKNPDQIRPGLRIVLPN